MHSGGSVDTVDDVDDAVGMDAVDDALGDFLASLDRLITVVEGGQLDSYDDLSWMAFVQAFEKGRNRIPLVDHRIVADCEARRVAEVWTQPSVARLLVSALRISAAEANRRVRAAEAVGARISMTGEVLDASRPVLAAAQRTGEVNPEQVHVIQRALATVDRPGFDPVDITAGEELLTGYAATFEPKVLGQLADQVVAAIDPDGTLPDDRLNSDRRYFSIRPTRDGAYVGEFRLTGVLGAKLSAVLRPLAKPRVERGAGCESADAAPLMVVTDERTHGQRMHDAMEDVCDRVLRSGDLPDTGGTPATVIVTVAADDLVDRLGYGRTSDGAQLSVAQVLDLAAEADIIPTVLNRAGAVLSQGRARRIATTAQTWALIARDGGCSFPACDRPPELCERHHLVPWIAGGLTNLDNLTLLCRYHHHQFAGRGWTAAMNVDGLPEWTPPAWIDRQRRPLVNTRIQLAQLAPPDLGRHVPPRAVFRRSRDAPFNSALPSSGQAGSGRVASAQLDAAAPAGVAGDAAPAVGVADAAPAVLPQALAFDVELFGLSWSDLRDPDPWTRRRQLNPLRRGRHELVTSIPS